MLLRRSGSERGLNMIECGVLQCIANCDTLEELKEVGEGK